MRQHNDSIGSDLPAFDANGRLPVGVYEARWEVFERRFGWNERRRKLIAGLLEAGNLLYRAGCRYIYVDGSLITSKELPGDYDALWDTEGVDTNFLLRLAPELFDMRNERATQKARFGGEFRPATKGFLDFFQFDTRTQTAKGIVRITLGPIQASAPSIR